jgi:hypothetical protein
MKLKKVILILSLLLGFLTLGFIRNNDDLLKKIAAQLELLEKQYPQEKVHVHLDKPYYAIGDTIWFKTYVTIGAEHALSGLSGIVYVDLINDNDSIKRSVKLPLTSGLAWGDFILSDSLKEGNYRIRAYTNWMRNASEEYFFDKTLYIGNAISNSVFTQADYSFKELNNQHTVEANIHFSDLDGNPYVEKEVTYEAQLESRPIIKGRGITGSKGNLKLKFINAQPFLLKSGRIVATIKLDDKNSIRKIVPLKTTTDQIDVQFFPESGQLVAGLSNRVAFKATGADGLGAFVKGTIIDQNQNNIADFTSRHLGMGAFNLNVSAGNSYKAKVVYPDGSEKLINLPQVIEKGCVLALNTSDPNIISLKLGVSQSFLADKPDRILNVVAQSGGKILYAAKTKLESRQFSAQIPKNRFPSGIVQFTLFDETGEPLNERLIFVKNPDQVQLEINTDKTEYGPREKVMMNLQAKSPEGKPVVGSFSVSVIDETKVPVDETSETSILSSLLLSSDLKGYIEKPHSYFINNDQETAENLDLLMLTQGYRRFSWKQLLNDQFPLISFQPEKVLEIYGRIKTIGGKPAPNSKVMLLSTTGGNFVLDTITDAEGRFRFTNLYFTDSTKFVIQARTEKNKRNLEIELDHTLTQIVTRNKNSADVRLNTEFMKPYLINSKNHYDDLRKNGQINRVITLGQVTITEKNTKAKNSSNLNGAGAADQTITSDQLDNCFSLVQCLQGRLNGVLFRGGIPYSTRSMNIPMQIIVDGMPVDNFFLDNIVPNDVATIEVLRSIGYTSIYGIRGGGGVIVITTKRGEPNYNYSKYAPGIINYSPQGYYISREFYAPRYDHPEINKNLADLRSTIFWKPDVLTDKEGKTSFDYFNNDGKGLYRVIIEGIDEDGRIARKIYRYQVK